MIIALVIVAVIVVLTVRRRLKRGMVAGLDKPATWREPPPGRVGSRRTEGL